MENLWFKYDFNWLFKRYIRKKLTLEVADNEQSQLVNELNGVDNGVKRIRKKYFLNNIGLFLAARMSVSVIKGISSLISKGMSNIYLKVNIEKNWPSQNSIIYVWTRGLGAKLHVAFLIFQFWKDLWRFTLESYMHIVGK